jgi:hypothetical protein
VIRIDDVQALLKKHLADEADAGFPRLTRIPSSSMIRLLDYMGTLSSADRNLLLDTFAQISALRFFPTRSARERTMELVSADPAYLRYFAAMQSPAYKMGLRHQGLRMTKAMLADPVSIKMVAQTRATLDFVPRDDLPRALVRDPDFAHLKPSKAPSMRRLINNAFKDLFAAQRQQVHGETAYLGSLEGATLTVMVDFAAMGLQLRYGVSIPDDTRTLLISRLAYEDLWAAGQGWDYLTEENVAPSVGLLCDQVVQLVRIRNQVRALI